MREIIINSAFDDTGAQTFLIPTDDNMADIDPNAWFENMEKDGFWCDYPFLWLTANYFKKEIIVLPIHKEDGHGGTGQINTPPNVPTVGEPFYFLNYSNVHFQSIRPKETNQ